MDGGHDWLVFSGRHWQTMKKLICQKRSVTPLNDVHSSADEYSDCVHLLRID